MANKKILSLSNLLTRVKSLKKMGKKIVTYNGSFDLIQIGHIRTIQEAKNQGDVLIVLLNSDHSIRQYKGPNRPIVCEEERSELIAGVEGVDYVHVFNELNPTGVLSEIKPDVHCNGPEWGENCIERSVVEKYNGKIYITNTKRVSSTTGLINKIIETYSKPTVKAVFIDRDGTINDNDEGYVHKISDFKFLPEAVSGLQRLSKTEFKTIIITNQSGIGRGYYSQRDFQSLTGWMIKTLKQKKVRIDKVYHCPHVAEDNCECRKPKIGMFLRAVEEVGISLNDSWFVGDDERDVIAGRNANIKTIKLGDQMPANLKLEPNYYAKNLAEAVKIILG